MPRNDSHHAGERPEPVSGMTVTLDGEQRELSLVETAQVVAALEFADRGLTERGRRQRGSDEADLDVACADTAGELADWIGRRVVGHQVDVAREVVAA